MEDVEEASEVRVKMIAVPIKLITKDGKRVAGDVPWGVC
jgi:hypothetical protein|tara:strand:+ start:677 stop:793 length:117 start_codon:yes stop_codon:yes gene_type:complete